MQGLQLVHAVHAVKMEVFRLAWCLEHLKNTDDFVPIDETKGYDASSRKRKSDLSGAGIMGP